MTISVMPAADGEQATLDGLVDDAIDSFGHTPCTVVVPGGSIAPMTHTCFKLYFMGDSATFTIATQHVESAIFL